MAVHRCMCTGITFAEVKRCAEELGGGYEETIAHTRCGEGCGLCLPYVKLVLLTGLTDLPVLTPEVYLKLIAQYSQKAAGETPGANAPNANAPNANVPPAQAGDSQDAR